MKTKTNKVPLVGPKGRRELLDKIEELEKKVIELENGGSSQKTVVEINGSVEEGTMEEALAVLTIDGEPATLEKLRALENPEDVIISRYMGAMKLSCTCLYKTTNRLGIYGGYVIPGMDDQVIVKIYLNNNGNCVATVYEI